MGARVINISSGSSLALSKKQCSKVGFVAIAEHQGVKITF